MNRVSIIMGIFNCATTLPEAIDSILHQTFTGWRLIMCDDGSSDDTYVVAKEYQNRFPEKIVLIKNDRNMGLNYTLNHCLQYADTEFVARMDGDDISLPTRLEEEVAFLDANRKYSIVSCPMIYFDEVGDFRVGRGEGEPSAKSFVVSSPFCHASSVVRREAYEAVGGYSLRKERLRVEDWDLWIRMYEKGYLGYMLDIPLYRMRDDRNAYNRRKYVYRINEARVISSAVYKLKLNPIFYLYSLKPLIVGVLPKPIYDILHKR